MKQMAYVSCTRVATSWAYSVHQMPRKSSFMTNRHRRSRIISSVIAIVLLLHVSPALASGATQDDDGERGVVVRFTKWVTAVVPANPALVAPRRLLMAGIVRGDVGAGAFVGEVLDRKVSTLGNITVPIVALHAIYEVQAGEYSFTALIQGGQNNAGRGLLDGVILEGWQTGARVHVEFRTLSSCIDRDGVTHGPCFRGTIRILADSDDSTD